MLQSSSSPSGTEKKSGYRVHTKDWGKRVFVVFGKKGETCFELLGPNHPELPTASDVIS